MNKLENNILTSRLNKLKDTLVKDGIFKDRGVAESDQMSYSFVVYTIQRFLGNYTLDNEILESITEGSGDNDIDIFHIEESGDEATVSIFQSKYKQENNLNSTIGEKEVSSFLQKINQIFIDADDNISPSNPYLARQLKKFNELLLDSVKVRIEIYLATNGSYINQQEEKKLKKFQESNKSVITKFDVLCSYDFYIDNADSEIENVELPVSEEYIGVNQEIMSYVVTTTAYQIALLFEKYKERILEKNVRKLLKGKTNKLIEESLKTNPKMFWHKNNGLSIVCRRVEKKKINGKLSLEMENPYIVNGGQTTKTIYNLLAKVDRNSEEEVSMFHDAKILVRVYQTTNDDDISSIVLGTNNQNKITVSDLKSLNPNINKIKMYLSEHGVSLLTKRDSELQLSSRSITTDLLLQVYWATFGGEPHKSKANKSKLVEEKYDEVYSDISTFEQLYTSYLLYEDAVSKLKSIDNDDIQRHGLYSVLFAMCFLNSDLKKKYNKDKSDIAFLNAIDLINSLLKTEKENDQSFSAHNFFKSGKSTIKISESSSNSTAMLF